METKYLRDFLAVAKYTNFGIAAESLFESASVLSKHISSLEHELNIKLFDRTTRCVTLTEYGKLFLQYAPQIRETEDTFRRDLAAYTENSGNTLCILAIPVILHYGVTKMLSLFIQDHPEINLLITECQPHNLNEYNKEGSFDLVICGEQSISGGTVKCITICKSSIVAVMRAEHPLASQKSVSLSQLRGERFLLNDETTNLYKFCIDQFSAVGFTPNVVYKGTRPESILQFADQGMGIALMAKQVAEYYKMKSIRCVDIEPVINVLLNLEWDEKHPMKPSAKLLIQYLTKAKQLA